MSWEEFFDWVFPRLHLRSRGFRNVRRQVEKRILRRIRTLDLADLDDYRRRLEQDPAEWAELESLCRVTISRFLRDRDVFERLGSEVLPELARAARARRDSRLSVWSLGAGAGEEPYSLSIVWHELLQSRFPDLALSILGTDIDRIQLERAAIARYTSGSLRELPEAWRDRAFDPVGSDVFELRKGYREGVVFREQDVRRAFPDGPFDLVLCRNVVFTYFDSDEQRRILDGIRARLVPRGALVIGKRERLPESELACVGVALYRNQPLGTHSV